MTAQSSFKQLRAKALISAAWSASESIVSAVTAFVGLVILAKLLSPADFGVFAVAVAAIEITAYVVSMPLQEALVRFEHVDERHFNAAFTASFLIAAGAFLILWMVFPILASLISDERIIPVGRALAVTVLAAGPAAVLFARQQRSFEFRVLALRTTVSRVIGLAVGVGLAATGFGVWSLVGQQIAAAVIGAVLLFWAAELAPRFASNVSVLRPIIGYGLTSSAAAFLNYLIKRVFLVLAGTALGVHQTGILNIAFRLVDTFWAVCASALSQVVLPAFARLQGTNNDLRSAFSTSLKLCAVVVYPLFLGLSLVSPEVVRIIFGDKWSESISSIILLCVLATVGLPALILAPLISVTGRAGSLLMVNIGTLLITLACTKLLQPASSFNAILIWSLISISYAVMISLTAVRLSLASIREQLQPLRVPLTGCALMLAAGLCLRYSVLADASDLSRATTLVISGAGTYVAALLAFDRPLVLSVLGAIKR